MRGVNITLANGQLGATVQTNDGVVGLVCTGGIDGYALNAGLLITSMANAAVQGVTAAGSPFLYRQLNDFFTLAGSGSQIYVLPVTNTVTLGQMDSYAASLRAFAQGKIKVMGITTDDTEVYGGAVTVTNGLNADVYTLLAAMVTECANAFAAQQPYRCIIGGTSYNGVPADLVDETAGTTNNRCAILIGDNGNAPGGATDQACVGALLGDIATLPVQRKISRVRNGPMPNVVANIGAITVGDAAHAGDYSVIAEKGFITWWTYPNVAGLYWSGDDTCSAKTDDYHYLARGRVIDKAHILAYTTFVQEVDDEMAVNADGTLDAGFCKWLSAQIVNQINTAMTANGEISSVSCFIDPSQNILANNQLAVVLKIVPVGYATDIEVTLGF